jgi:FixJ family two-component response regulator
MTVTNKLIAVVDDDASARDALSALVKAFGFVVAAFSSGAAFLASAELRNTTCLIADMQMPDMSGLQLFLALLEGGLSIPTILVTAYRDDATERRALRAGVAGFLAKPVDSERLLACLRRAVGNPPERTQGT